MAKLYGEIAAKALLTLDKSFARANGQPLDASEVYYSLAAAKEYAATAQAYIGQKIVVIENGVVSHYSVEDTAGNLKELGSKPVADGTTVAIGTDGKITLANITEAEKNGTYNAVLVNGALTWVKPSSTTVEGLSDLITALTGRVDTAEADIDALQSAVGVAAKEAVGEEGAEGYEPAVAATGLHKAIADEKARAEAAEKALGERIDNIDYIDGDELATALEPYAKSADVVDKETYATDKKALEDEDAAIRAIAEGVRDSFNTFMNSEEIDETVNTLKEVQAEIAKMTDATELATALASKADKTYVDDELAKKQDVIPENTYDAYGSAATAKSEALEEVAGIYATQEALGNLETAVDGRLDALEAINHELYATKEALEAHEETAEATYATKEALEDTDDVAKDAQNRVGIVEGKIDEITAVGGEPNVVEKIKVNGVTLEVEKDAEGKSTKTVSLTVPTKVSDLTDDTGFDARITAAQAQADKGVEEAGKANAAATQAQSEVDALEEVVGGHTTKITNLETSVQGHTDRILALETDNTTNKGDIASLKTQVLANAEALGGKADATTLQAAVAKIGANETALATLNQTTIPGINAEVAKKADASTVYTIDQINAITGTVAENKTLVDMINDAKSEATYDDTAIKGLIQGNTDAIAVLNGGADVAGSVIAIANAQAKAEVAAIVGAAPEAMNTLEEVANWIENDETGAAAMAKRITANETAIAAINNTETGILATANAYADALFAGLPIATAERAGIVKVDDKTIQSTEGVISVKAVSTDLLVQGSAELILDGGSASGANTAN